MWKRGRRVKKKPRSRWPRAIQFYRFMTWRTICWTPSTLSNFWGAISKILKRGNLKFWLFGRSFAVFLDSAVGGCVCVRVRFPWFPTCFPVFKTCAWSSPHLMTNIPTAPSRLMISVRFSPITRILMGWATACHAWCMATKVWDTAENQCFNCHGGLFFGLVLVLPTGFSWSPLVLTSTTLGTMRGQLQAIQWLIGSWPNAGDLLVKPTSQAFLRSLELSSSCFLGLLVTIHFKQRFARVWEATFEKRYAPGAWLTLDQFLLKIAPLRQSGERLCFRRCHGSRRRLSALFLVVTIPLSSSGTWCICCHMVARETSVHLWCACWRGPWVCLYRSKVQVWKKIDACKQPTTYLIPGSFAQGKACEIWKSSRRRTCSGSWTETFLTALAKPVIAFSWPSGFWTWLEQCHGRWLSHWNWLTRAWKGSMGSNVCAILATGCSWTLQGSATLLVVYAHFWLLIRNWRCTGTTKGGACLGSPQNTITQAIGMGSWPKLCKKPVHGHGILVHSAHLWWRTSLVSQAGFQGQFTQGLFHWTRSASILWKCAGCGSKKSEVCVKGAGMKLMAWNFTWSYGCTSVRLLSRILMTKYFCSDQLFLNIGKAQKKVIRRMVQVYNILLVI